MVVTRGIGMQPQIFYQVRPTGFLAHGAEAAGIRVAQVADGKAVIGPALSRAFRLCREIFPYRPRNPSASLDIRSPSQVHLTEAPSSLESATARESSRCES